MRRCHTRSLLRAAVLSFSILPLTSALSYKTNEYLANVSTLTNSPKPPKTFTNHHRPKFDDLSNDHAISDIGVYQTMYWHNLFATPPSPDSESPSHGGLYPKSLKGDGLQQQSTMACHDTLTASLFGAARLSTNYFNSQVALFDLQSFSFGCVVLDPDTHLASTTPKPCALAVKGYSPGRSVDRGLHKYKKRGSDGVAELDNVKPSLEMTLWFTNDGEQEPTPETKMRMVKMESLDSTWWALGAVTFEAVADGPVQLCVDDVAFRTYNITKWGETFAPPEHEAAFTRGYAEQYTFAAT